MTLYLNSFVLLFFPDFTRSNYFPSLQDSSDSLCSILEITGHWHRVPCNQGKYMSLCEVPAFYTLFQFHTLHPNPFHSGVITPTFSPRTFPSYPTLTFPSYDALTPPSFPHPYNPFSPPSTENYPPYPQPVAPFPPTYPPYDGRIPPQYPIYPYPPYPGGFTTLSPGSYPSYSTSDPYPSYPGGFTTLSPGSYPSYSTSGPFPPLRPTEQVPTYGTPPTYPTYIPSTLPPPFFTTNSIPPPTSNFPSYVPLLPTESTTIAPPTNPPATTPPPTYTNPPLPPTTPTKSPPPTYSTPTSTYGPPQVPQTLPPAAPPQYPSYYPSTRPSVYYPSLPQPPTKFPQTPSFAYPGPSFGVSPAPFPPRPPYDTPPLNYHPLPNPPIIYHHPPHPPQYPSYKPNYRPPPNYNPPYQPPNRVPFNLTPPPPPPGYECQVTSPPLAISTFPPAIDPYFPPLYIYPPGYQGQPLPGLPTPHYKGYVPPAPHPSNIPYRPFFNYHDKPPFQGKTFIVKDDQAYEIPTVNHHHHHADWERGYSINGRSVSVGNQTNGTPSTHHSQTQFTNTADSNTGRFLTAKLSDQNNLSGNNSDAKFFLSQTHYSRNQFNPNDDLQPKKEQNGTVEIDNDKTTHRKENTTTVINRNSSFNTNVEYTRSGKIPSRATVEIQRGGVVSRILPNKTGVDSLY